MSKYIIPSLPERFFVRTPTEAIFNAVNERMSGVLGIDEMCLNYEESLESYESISYDPQTEIGTAPIDWHIKEGYEEVTISELFDSKYDPEPESKDETVTLEMTREEAEFLAGILAIGDKQPKREMSRYSGTLDANLFKRVYNLIRD